MATIQRPVKTYGNRTYAAEVAAAPGNEDPILASEVDGDLDTIYAAWNGGADTVNIKDGVVTFAKLATDAKPWTITATTITPTDATKKLAVPGDTATTGDVLIGGGRTAKLHLVAHNAADTGYLMFNRGLTAVDDGTRAAWHLTLSGQSDNFQIGR